MFKISLLDSDGSFYPGNVREARLVRESNPNVLQLCMLSWHWARRRLLTFCPVFVPPPPPLPTVPRVVAVSPQMRLVEDNPSSLSLVEIYKQRCAKKGIEHDNPISRYYDRLATVQARGTQASHQVSTI